MISTYFSITLAMTEKGIPLSLIRESWEYLSTFGSSTNEVVLNRFISNIGKQRLTRLWGSWDQRTELDYRRPHPGVGPSLCKGRKEP